ncbi:MULTISPECIES: SRPBCC family protein [unclassified Pseudonocardia]|jgi:hypothetical protein|uniref:SRPBCC family protein n=1 Tax=unclassified Pseudonocardia TaxID=2619320 RepID=UPI00095C2638|nr:MULTISPECIES: SRPBCC family protein [unclassified Pseudonocardia]MBN9100154.1 SRPBCC family protein [Pseudonocardia sp.]OJY50271.1 MAG: hypothetical protein BGP03_12640 [Pseudonocardia sp. 73-21]
MRVLPLLLGSAGLAAAVVRVGRRTGVTDDELAAVLPGDDVVPGARVVMDRATTLPAPPEQVWPWLVQLGKQRSGWYLPAWLETAIPWARRGIRTIDPRWQGLTVGDVIPDWGGADATFEVVVLDAPRALVHRSTRPRRHGGTLQVSWALVLTPVPGGRTRLHLRLRISELGHRAPALITAVGGLMDEATVRPMFAGLRERLAYSRKPTVPVTDAG